ncbi:hypothetical protein GQX74_011731, partial [Glossina fuscipes]
ITLNNFNVSGLRIGQPLTNERTHLFFEEVKNSKKEGNWKSKTVKMKKISLSARLEYVRTFHKSAANYMLEFEQSESASNAADFVSSATSDSLSSGNTSEACICGRGQREPQWVECTKCHKFFKGRVSAICKAHPKVIYLMDFNCCPSCGGSKKDLKAKVRPKKSSLQDI